MSSRNPEDVVIDLDSLPPSRGRNGGFHATLSSVHRAHSRSASWSLPGGQSPRPGRGLVSLNPMTPFANVIREIVPSFGHRSRTSDSNGIMSPHGSRNPSQTSLLLGTSERDREEGPPEQSLHEPQDNHGLSSGHDLLRTLGDSSSNVNVHLPREHLAVHVGTQGPPEEPIGGLELTGSMQWLEQNAIFMILILMKFAWYHRSGKASTTVISTICSEPRRGTT